MARYRVIPEKSRLWAEARSSLHPVHVETDGLTGNVEALVTDGEVTLTAPFRVEIDAERLRSGNGLVDAELQRRLDTRKFPRVIGSVAEAEAREGRRFLLRGELTLHGVTRATDAEVSVRALGDDMVEIEGEKVIDMQDYGLNPPKLFMFRVYPEVKVRARLVAAREG
jgi:polyisoprenoid-binding protein YceI